MGISPKPQPCQPGFSMALDSHDPAPQRMRQTHQKTDWDLICCATWLLRQKTTLPYCHTHTARLGPDAPSGPPWHVDHCVSHPWHSPFSEWGLLKSNPTPWASP